VFGPSEDPAAWDSGGVGSPHMVWMDDAQRWRMYYLGSSSQGDGEGGVMGAGAGIGVAESLDENGIYFKRLTL
jgi:hypothetical protein